MLASCIGVLAKSALEGAGIFGTRIDVDAEIGAGVHESSVCLQLQLSVDFESRERAVRVCSAYRLLTHPIIMSLGFDARRMKVSVQTFPRISPPIP
jgi:hypothetical protein